MSLNLETVADNFNLDYYLTSILKYQRNKAYYDKIIKPKLEKLEFRPAVTIVPKIDHNTIEIFVGLTPETDTTQQEEFNANKDRNYHVMIADIVKNFDIKLERKFSEYGGKFYWYGVWEALNVSGIDTDYNKTLVVVRVDDAPVGTCKIVEVKETSVTTKYKAECF